MRIRIIIQLFLLLLLPVFASCERSSVTMPGEIVLKAKDADTRDPAWTKRHYYGLETWGIRGSGVSEEGEMSFKSFPGASGNYRVRVKAVFENDGSPHIAVRAGGRALFEGRFPYPSGKKDCNARGGPGVLDLGIHQLNSGETISVWGRSVYECGEDGAYSLWDSLKFTPEMSVPKMP